jgi:hypothetical protein
MKTSVATIRNLCAVVLVLAIDASFVHDFLADDGYFPLAGWPMLFRFGFAGSLPAASVVVVAGVMALPKRGERPFLAGFAVAGAIALFAMLALALLAPWEWFRPWFRQMNIASARWHRAYAIPMTYGDFLIASETALFTAIFSTPELLVALAGGFLFQRIRNPRRPSARHADAPVA